MGDVALSLDCLHGSRTAEARSVPSSDIDLAIRALVSGLAHEARNPLFAISATLDAFDANFGGRSEYQEYLGGFRSQDLPRIFAPLFSRRQGGIGLGLASCRRVVEAYGGVISAANRDCDGSAITVLLPARAGALAKGKFDG